MTDREAAEVVESLLRQVLPRGWKIGSERDGTRRKLSERGGIHRMAVDERVAGG